MCVCVWGGGKGGGGEGGDHGETIISCLTLPLAIHLYNYYTKLPYIYSYSNFSPNCTVIVARGP